MGFDWAVQVQRGPALGGFGGKVRSGSSPVAEDIRACLAACPPNAVSNDFASEDPMISACAAECSCWPSFLDWKTFLKR